MRVLAAFHLYYEDQLPYFLSRLENLGKYDADLIVTGKGVSEEALSELKKLFPNLIYKETNNVGYDIWPFLLSMKEIAPESYDVIIKLHTKAPYVRKKAHIDGCSFPGYGWRDEMVDSLIGDGKTTDETIEIFGNNPKVGMVCSAKVYSILNSPEDGWMLEEELKKWGIAPPEDRRVCYGTIFAIRGSALKALPLDKLDEDYFKSETVSHSGSTRAHVYERMLSFAPLVSGYEVYLKNNSEELARKRRIRRRLDKIFSIHHDYSTPASPKYLMLFGKRF